MAGAVPPWRSNFLLLIADNAMGDPEMDTPHLNALMSRGCTFSNRFH
jgi:hypothetical protein